MKKLILLVLFFTPLFYSCQTLEITKFPREEVLYGIDFTKYTKSGFFITPEKYTKDYESIGLVEFVYLPSAVLVDKNTSNASASNKVWVFDGVEIQDAVDGIYKRCIEMGANALINFKYTVEEKEYITIKNPVIIKGYRLSGFAIKTKE